MYTVMFIVLLMRFLFQDLIVAAFNLDCTKVPNSRQAKCHIYKRKVKLNDFGILK